MTTPKKKTAQRTRPGAKPGAKPAPRQPTAAATSPARRGTTAAKASKASKTSKASKASPKPAGQPATAVVEPASRVATAPRPSAPPPPASDPSVIAQIKELEAQLDRLLEQHDLEALTAAAPRPSAPPRPAEPEPEAPVLEAAPDSEPSLPEMIAMVGDDAELEDEDAPESESELAAPREESSIPPPPSSVLDTARDLLEGGFIARRWGRLAMRGRAEEVDDFGLDRAYEAKLKPMLDFLYGTYFRVETTGIENVPGAGRCLLVANHSGTLPLDGVMLKTAVKREHPSPRDVRWLTEDFITHFPWLGSSMNRLGAVRAHQENAERLLARGELVAVFPEGVKGIGKLFKDRYRLQRFGRGGFVKLALRTGTPIVPVAIVGAEETSPLLFKIEHLAKQLGVPYIPVTPTFPLLGPLGLLPAPTKWRIQIGELVDLSAHEPEAADDELLVGKIAERVRASIQGMLDAAIGARKSVFFG